MTEGRAPWFVAMPDSAAGAATARMVRRRMGAASVVEHPSGRPWLIGEWAPYRLATGRARHRALAVVGEHDVTADRLDRYAAALTGAGDLDGLDERIPGSVHLVASVAGVVRVQGTVSGLRRVYHCEVGGVPVAGDNAGVLARLSDAPVNAARLAVCLLYPAIPLPSAWHTMWNGVDAVLPGHCLVLSAGGTVRQAPCWDPSTGRPVATLAEARAARRALDGPVVMAGLSAGGSPETDAPVPSYEGVLTDYDTFDLPFPYLHYRRRFEASLGSGSSVMLPVPPASDGSGAAPVMPAWATPDAVAAVGRILEAEAEVAEGEPGPRIVQAQVRSQAIAAFQRLATGHGVVLAVPDLDDRVLAAAHGPECSAPGGYGPAGQGRGPGARYPDEIMEAAEGSLLARMGLIDAAELRTALTRPADARTPAHRIEPTLACEAWIRNRRRDVHG
ncbi:hypothetical protein [Actinomadura sp. 9N215]|uniref:hypothetical protein n=1 Tax=Actinomadura sp. 9N215 TaxID=3375150 RepID=UPI00379A9DC3